MKIYPCFSLLKETRKGFSQLMHVSGQSNRKKFMLSVTETNHGLAYGRDVKVSFETFYDVIFEKENPPKAFPSKVSFFKYVSKINSVIYVFF